ncbi:Ig-like domain repeat protein [Solwaraspora sp. WMMD406]|uniref:Ig-like domain repeat protein n=1 Tax=Solwaraspora sp. WMMD406 TaxID=3016095 RepID=UPI002417BB64|nr:Ig-like domain repeat protein [Solwaraspora sp. WMMD406]MDG4764963.1 Ig-like domain repeat protein [Solwaraspora sp. WMMD406]
MSKRVFARAAALLGAAALTGGVLVAVAAPAQAASLGEVQLSQTSGGVSDEPMFVSASSAACPAGFGENAGLRIGRPGGPYSNLGRPLGGGGFDSAPVTIEANRSFTTSIGGSAPAAGEWWVIIECYSLTEGRHPDEFVTPITVSGTTWRVPIAEATSTTLAVAPASPVEQGDEVTLTATVTPGAAEGTVQFRRGASVIGTAPVTGGTATLTTTALPVGTHSLTATFTPADATAFSGSVSSAATYTITASSGSINDQQEIIADVEAGAFTLDVAGDTALLTGGSVGGSATGELHSATVTDLRGSNAGWDLTGQLADFVGPTATISSGNLSWTPSATRTSGSGVVTAGATADLGETRTLCSTAVGASAGQFTCDADLELAVPDDVAPGEYSATLTLTLA